METIVLLSLNRNRKPVFPLYFHRKPLYFVDTDDFSVPPPLQKSAYGDSFYSTSPDLHEKKSLQPIIWSVMLATLMHFARTRMLCTSGRLRESFGRSIPEGLFNFIPSEDTSECSCKSVVIRASFLSRVMRRDTSQPLRPDDDQKPNG